MELIEHFLTISVKELIKYETNYPTLLSFLGKEMSFYEFLFSFFSLVSSYLFVFLYYFVRKMSSISIVEKKVMMVQAIMYCGETHVVHHNDLAGFQTRFTKKKKNMGKGKDVRLVHVNTVINVLIIGVTKSPKEKTNVTDLDKNLVIVNSSVSIKLETEGVMSCLRAKIGVAHF